MNESNDLISEDRKIDNFEDVRNIIDGNKKLEVLLIDSILNFDDKNIGDVFKAIEASGKDISFILECIEYFLLIRPLKIKHFFTLFCLVARKYGYKKFIPISNSLRNLLICEGFISSNKEAIPVDDIYDIFPIESIERAIKDDDVDLFLEISSKPEFDAKKKIEVSVDSIFYNVNNDHELTYLQLMAFFGAEKCFKRAFLSGLYSDENLNIYAIAGGNYEIIQLLRSKSPHYYDKCFEISVRYHHYEISNWLLNNYKCEKISRASCLCYFNFLALNFFVENNINYIPIDFTESIFEATSNCNLPNIRFLIEERKIDVNEKDNNGWTPLHFASKRGVTEVARFLIECGANINAKTNNGWSPLHLVSINKCFNVARMLIECGANVNQVDKGRWSPLHFAAESGDLEVLKLLIENGANINYGDKCKWTPLHHALYNGCLDASKFLIENGANVNIKNNDGQTPISFALDKGYLDIIKMIIEHGVSIDKKDYDKRTLLQISARNGHLPIVKFLVEQGANINEKDMDGCTPLHFAAEKGFVEVARFLIEKGANIDQKDSTHWTPLFYAVYNCRIGVLKLLIERGANINLKDEDGWTPLHISTTCGSLDIIKVLIESGADMNLKDNCGQTPLEYAIKESCNEVADLLKSKEDL